MAARAADAHAELRSHHDGRRYLAALGHVRLTARVAELSALRHIGGVGHMGGEVGERFTGALLRVREIWESADEEGRQALMKLLLPVFVL